MAESRAISFAPIKQNDGVIVILGGEGASGYNTYADYKEALTIQLTSVSTLLGELKDKANEVYVYLPGMYVEEKDFRTDKETHQTSHLKIIQSKILIDEAKSLDEYVSAVADVKLTLSEKALFDTLTSGKNNSRLTLGRTTFIFQLFDPARVQSQIYELRNRAEPMTLSDELKSYSATQKTHIFVMAHGSKARTFSIYAAGRKKEIGMSLLTDMLVTVTENVLPLLKSSDRGAVQIYINACHGENFASRIGKYTHAQNMAFLLERGIKLLSIAKEVDELNSIDKCMALIKLLEEGFEHEFSQNDIYIDVTSKAKQLTGDIESRSVAKMKLKKAEEAKSAFETETEEERDQKMKEAGWGDTKKFPPEIENILQSLLSQFQAVKELTEFSSYKPNLDLCIQELKDALDEHNESEEADIIKYIHDDIEELIDSIKKELPDQKQTPTLFQSTSRLQPFVEETNKLSSQLKTAFDSSRKFEFDDF